MRKIFTFLMLFAAMSMSGTATVFTFTSAADVNQAKDGINLTLAKATGNNQPYFDQNASGGPELRMYAKNTITVSGEGLENIQIVFAKPDKAYATLTASTGSLISGGTSTGRNNPVVDVWTGNASEVVFTLGDSGQRIIRKVVVNGEPVNPDEPAQPTDSTQQALDSTYVYGDTAFVVRPTEGVYGAAYSFVANNILVSATKGSITDNYFNCQADQHITFTATKPFKGIVIDGLVKNEFSASVDKGNISYVATTGDDVEADPVIVITDIDSTSVTINCAKQLRCYEVRVFFAANPEDSINGTSGGGETFFLDYNAASYDLYEIVSDSDYNYTLYLWDRADEEKYIGLDIYTTAELAFEGVYSFEKGNLSKYSFYNYGKGEYDYYDVIDGAVAITKENDVYSINGYIDCTDGNTYNFTFSGDIYEEGVAKDTIFVNVTKADALDWSTDTIRSEEGAYNYMLRMETDTIYPWIRISLYSEQIGDLSGNYSYYGCNIDFELSHVQLSEAYSDFEELYDAEFTITKNGDSYHIVGWVQTTSMALYEFDYEGEVPFVSMLGLEDTKDGVKATKLLRDGQLIIVRGEKKYNVLGTAL